MPSHPQLTELLSAIQPTLSTLEGGYCIIGSSALVLAGIHIEKVSDLDILTSWEDADRLKSVWAERRKAYTPEQTSLFRSNFARFSFKTMDVEVMGDLEVNKNGTWQKLVVYDFMEVSIAEHLVRIPTLAEQKRIFTWFGREKDLRKADLINEMSD